jgi:hypothetical protein
MPKAEELVEVHCNKCGAETNHAVEHTYRRSWEEVLDEGENYRHTIDGWDQWETLRCLGCNTVHLRKLSYFSEDCGPRGEPTVSYTHYPARLSRRKPKWRDQIYLFNAKVYDLSLLLDEVYQALAMGSCRLAAMGVRALVEQVMIDQVGDQGGFKPTIKAFFGEGYVAARQQGAFEKVLIEAGHAAMHRGFNPDPDTIETLLDIVEPLVDEIYFKPQRTAKAEKSIPPRV